MIHKYQPIGTGDCWDCGLPYFCHSEYRARVMELELEGLNTSDAQGVADVEFIKMGAQS